jgi:hypothetical protein
MKNCSCCLLPLLLLVLFGLCDRSKTHCHAFSAAATSGAPKKVVDTISSDEYKNAMSIIDASSKSGTPSDDLYDAVKIIDRNARYVYPDEESKEDLWKRAYGSWKLVFATGGGKSKTFKPLPIFAFAMLDEENFGNGVGINENMILLSLLGPHELITKRRMMMINIDDVFLASKKVTDNVPKFLGEGIGLGKRPIDYKNNGSGSGSGRAPAFVFLAASETSLVARGGTGGIAIWTRLEKDIRPSAYNINSS